MKSQQTLPNPVHYHVTNGKTGSTCRHTLTVQFPAHEATSTMQLETPVIASPILSQLISLLQKPTHQRAITNAPQNKHINNNIINKSPPPLNPKHADCHVAKYPNDVSCFSQNPIQQSPIHPLPGICTKMSTPKITRIRLERNE